MSRDSHQERRSRWGSSHSHSHSHKPAPAPAPARGVSDDEALRALLSSAQDREEERTTVKKEYGGGRDRDRDRDRGGTKRSRDPPRPLPKPGNQRLAANDSYYGPGADENDATTSKRRRRAPEHEEEREQEGSVGGRGRGRGRGPTAVEREHNKNESEEDDEEPPPPTHKPNFGLSGALAKDTSGDGTGSRVYKGVLLKFQEPPEARTPNTQWRFYVFKKQGSNQNDQAMLDTLHISKQSAYLFGRNADICDIVLAHPSLSSQHAVLQYRALPSKEREGRVVCQPYIMDLESTNGTFLNGIKIDPARYYQLKKGDVLIFGASTREYVLLTENSTALR